MCRIYCFDTVSKAYGVLSGDNRLEWWAKKVGGGGARGRRKVNLHNAKAWGVLRGDAKGVSEKRNAVPGRI